MLEVLDESLPEWIEGINDLPSKLKMIALWATDISFGDEECEELIWGTEGLLQNWLEGDQKRAGLNTEFKEELKR